jgi:hypothetical protein
MGRGVGHPLPVEVDALRVSACPLFCDVAVSEEALDVVGVTHLLGRLGGWFDGEWGAMPLQVEEVLCRE